MQRLESSIPLAFHPFVLLSVHRHMKYSVRAVYYKYYANDHQANCREVITPPRCNL